MALALAQQRYVDAYRVGHNGLGKRYNFDTLRRAIGRIRLYTRRPVSTTEPIQRYLEDARLREVGDWLFPDVHLIFEHPPESRTFSADVGRDVSQLFDLAKALASKPGVAQEQVLLNMVAYPVDGIPGASIGAQAEFFSRIFDDRRRPHGQLPKNASIAVHGAFDQPWKTGGDYYPWDPHTGLFETTGEPRPATSEITQRMPP
jgi:exo-beta-1,3-glucanase (GH17 family)